jgi:hypothetical protein
VRHRPFNLDYPDAHQERFTVTCELAANLPLVSGSPSLPGSHRCGWA